MLHFVTSVAFLFCLLNQGDSVKLTLTSPVYHIRASSSLTLSCNVFELEDAFFSQDGSIVFFRHENNDRIILAHHTPTNSTVTSERYRVSGLQRIDRYIVDLQLTDIEERDATQYQCATYRAGNLEFASDEYDLQWIQTAPIEYPVCEARPQDGTWYLTCSSANSVPSPGLVWFYNGFEVSRNTEHQYGFHSNEISTNLTERNGTYECRFYYFGGGMDDERSCRIEKPNMTVISPANTEFMEGDDVRITVLARASPAMKTPIICTWDYDNSEDYYHVHTDGNDLAVITILDVDVTMNGSNIICCGRNFISDSCKSIFLFVRENIEPSSLKQEAEISQQSATSDHLIELIVIGFLVCTVIVLTAVVLVMCKRDAKKSNLSNISPFEEEMRSPSFTSTSAESHTSNADSGVNLQDAPCRLKRSATVPASRSLPAPPQTSLSQVHEFDGITYSVIKTDQPLYPKETNLQPYMDMGGNKKRGKALPTYSDELPPGYDNTVAGTLCSGYHDDVDNKSLGKDILSECSSLDTDSFEKVGYLEVKKDPSSQCQYQDLEDLYRETASNNPYAP